MGVKGTYHVPYGENRWTVVVTSANGRSTRQYAIYTRRFGPEHGVRHDGGDAETGCGVDIAGGIELAAQAQGLTVSLDGRGVLTHEASGLRDRGIAGTLAWSPPPSNGRGPKLTLSQTFGTGGSSGRDTLLARHTLEGLAANDGGGAWRRGSATASRSSATGSPAHRRSASAWRDWFSGLSA